MPFAIDWSEMALVDLDAIGDPGVKAELLQMARTEIDAVFLPGRNVDQGTVRTAPPPSVAWRRGIRRDQTWQLQMESEEEDQCHYRARDYVLVYRPPEPAESAAAATQDGRRIDYVVVRVRPASALAQGLPGTLGTP